MFSLGLGLIEVVVCSEEKRERRRFVTGRVRGDERERREERGRRR